MIIFFQKRYRVVTYWKNFGWNLKCSYYFRIWEKKPTTQNCVTDRVWGREGRGGDEGKGEGGSWAKSTNTLWGPGHHFAISSIDQIVLQVLTSSYQVIHPIIVLHELAADTKSSSTSTICLAIFFITFWRTKASTSEVLRTLDLAFIVWELDHSE